MSFIEDQTLWQFSVRAYSRAEVEQVCLVLQDRYGMDINLVLACCWTGLSGRGVLSPADLNKLDEAVASWRQQIIHPLRQLRKRLKKSQADSGLGMEFYRQIKALELKTEEAEQRQLMQMLDSRKPDRNKPDTVRRTDAWECLRSCPRSMPDRNTQPGEIVLRKLLDEILFVGYGL